MRARRKTRSRASSATTVGEVQSNEMPATASGAIPLWAIAFLTAATRHAHHSAGFCSAQPGRGCFKAYGSAAKVTGVPPGLPPGGGALPLQEAPVSCFRFCTCAPKNVSQDIFTHLFRIFVHMEAR